MRRPEAIAASLLAGAERVMAGLAELTPFLGGQLPSANDDLSGLAVVSRIASIALLKRFEQLQDQTARLARLAIELELERTDRVTVRDLANAMERRGIVGDADRWVDLNNLRNQLVHEYPVATRERVDRVNECWAATPLRIDAHQKLRAHLLAQGVAP